MDIFDDLAAVRLIPGNSYLYSIQAFTRDVIRWDDSEGLRSKATLLTVTAQWEALIKGHVLLSDRAGNLGVKDVQLTYNFANGTQTGSVTTDAGGAFQFRILTAKVLGLVSAPLLITVSKVTVSGSAEIVHTFSYNTVRLDNGLLLPALQPYSFDNYLKIIDETSVPVRGNVFIAGTGGDDRWGTQHNGNAQLSAFPYGCPLENVTVCVHDVYSRVQLACDSTDASGRYEMNVAAGMTVYLTLQHPKKHTFLLLPSSTRKPTADVEIVQLSDNKKVRVQTYYLAADPNEAALSVDFADVERRHLTVQMAGGFCNHSIGVTTIQLSYPTCGSEWLYQYEVTDYEGENHFRLMPAQLLEVELLKVHSLRGDGSRQTQQQVVDSIGTGVATTIDLQENPNTVRWVYHGKPELSLTLEGGLDGGCGFVSVATQSRLNVTITVVETIDWMNVTCDWVPGMIRRNQRREDAVWSSFVGLRSVFTYFSVCPFLWLVTLPSLCSFSFRKHHTDQRLG